MSISHKAKSTLGIMRRFAPRNGKRADKLDSDLIPYYAYPEKNTREEQGGVVSKTSCFEQLFIIQ